jgi:predicted acyl esterase
LSKTDQSAAKPGIVLVHGSGPQDRHGYASLIEFVATEFVEAGYVVLIYDKRGTGNSDGNWESAGFAELGEDAIAAAKALAQQPNVDGNRIGLGGSSQAGWVIAAAIKGGADPAMVFLLGAAGSAMTVEQQNIYNTQAQMRCASIRPDWIELALNQQRAFFRARIDPTKLQALQDASRNATGILAIQPWLFPSSVAPNATPQWYDVLDLEFDPLPIWQAYQRPVLFLFGQHDDSTDTEFVTQRLNQSTPSTNHQINTISNAQHLGLVAGSMCETLETRDRFSNEMLVTLRTWARLVANNPASNSVQGK